MNKMLSTYLYILGKTFSNSFSSLKKNEIVSQL